MRRARARGGGGEAGGGEATGSFSRPFVRTPPGFLTGPGPPKQTGGHGSRGETIPHEGLAPWKTPPQKERPASPTPHPPPPGGFGGRAHLGRGAKVSGVGVRTGGKGSGAPYSSARGQCRRGGSLEPPGRGASGAPGLLGQKVLREQLLRPPSAPPFEYAPPPADTGRGRPPRPRPAPRPRDLRRRAPAPPTAAGSASGARADEHAHSQFSPRRFPRTRSPFPAHTRPPSPLPPSGRTWNRERPAVPVTGRRGGGHEGSAQAQTQACRAASPSLARCARARGGAGRPSSWVIQNYQQTNKKPSHPCGQANRRRCTNSTSFQVFLKCEEGR